MAKKILLADDSITIQKVIELTFSDEDFDVITVGNGRLALERLAEVRPDVVLCDIIMPEKDGYEVCEHIKSTPAFSHVPVLLLTGAFEPFDQERASRAGYDGSLAKPFEPETLIAKVKELLSRAPSRAAAPAPAAPAPAPAPAPTVVPFARPASGAAAPLGGGFIPDDPFPDGPEAGPSTVAASPAAVPPLAALSEEESATLSTPPPMAGAEDAASTVMFRPGDLSWSPPEPASPARINLPEPKGEPEPTLVPESPAPLGAAMGEEPPVFEAVLEEDLDFGPAGFEPEPASEQPGGETLFAPEPAPDPPSPALEPSLPEPVPEPRSTAPSAPAEVSAAAMAEPAAASSLDELVSAAPPAPEPAFVEESLLQSEAAVEFSAEPVPDATVEAPPRVVPEPQPEPPPGAVGDPADAPVTERLEAPEPVAAAAPAPEPLPAPSVAEVPTAPPVIEVPSGAGPLADLALPVEEVVAPTPSQTAALSVPVDMVEKIAQRVVAQVSEKVVREIAWEVVPDLAEALIKQEIERLKAELQKT